MSSDKKLKIIHTEASPHWGGQEIRIFEEMKWFREQGHEMILVAPDNGTLFKRCKQEGFDVISIYFTKPRTFLNILKMLWIIWRQKPDVVGTHSSTDSWAGLIAAYCLRVKKRIRYRHVCTPVSANFINRIQYEKLATNIITTGNGTRESLLKSFNLNGGKIFCIPTAIQQKKIMLSKEEARSKLIRELSVDKKTRFIGIISVLRCDKGHLFLLDCFDQVASAFPELHLLIIGEGGMRSLLKERIAQLSCRDRVHMLGHKSNVYDYYRAFECFVLPSLKDEGIPQCLTQSMYANIPIIASNVRGINEVIQDRETGLLFESGSTVALSKCLKEILTNKKLACDLSEKANEMVLQSFTWGALGERTLKIMI